MNFYLANKCEKGAVQFPGTFCEHCGKFCKDENVITVCDGGTYWCEDCIEYNIFSDEELNEFNSFIKTIQQSESESNNILINRIYIIFEEHWSNAEAEEPETIIVAIYKNEDTAMENIEPHQWMRSFPIPYVREGDI